MRNKQTVTKIVFLIFILFLILLCMIFGLIAIKLTEKDEPVVSNVELTTKEPKTIKEAVEKHDATYISFKNQNVYLKFPKDLYNEDGSNNESYFENITTEVMPFYKECSFRLIDEEKNINLFAKYDFDNGQYTIYINNVEDFFRNVDSEAYVDVDKSKIVDATNFAISDHILQTLGLYNNDFSSIKKYLDEGKELENGYTSYNNGQIKIRCAATGAVKNIIFSDDYEGRITYKIDTSMSLEEIAEAEKNYVFGSVEEGYLGYRHSDFYLFFYEDEISVYTYSYKENRVFETYLKEYVETGDLKKFVGSLSIDWIAYDSFKFEADIQKAEIMYSTRGVDIDIEENSPKGITLYSNYCFTDLTRRYVKDGIISFESNTDLVEKIEIERRENS